MANNRDEDQDPPTGSDKEKKRSRKGKDFEPPKKSSKSKESSKGKTQSKPSSTVKPVNAEEPLQEAEIDVEEQILYDVVNEADQPQDDAAPTKGIQFDTLTFDELMATLIDFTKFAMNRLKLDKITKADLVGPIYKLLKGTCKSKIKVEYKMNQCYNALMDQLDWTNPEEIVVRRADRKLYTFKEVALRMFTRRIIIQKRVEDVQLLVESYQKKLNITKPQKDFSEISAKEPYTTSYDPKRVVYLNSSKRKRLMRVDELYKFSDRTL
uniref:Uncharacterized protein n=1 Tax=Tanacetum cinerariifolium TaxID=118510 RepID=A0A6L2KB63_TANCI|nr:hypothetical protein [Tanacetum cinerariifolium]